MRQYTESSRCLVAVGNAFDGIDLHGRPGTDGEPFADADEAGDYAERSFPGSTWYVVTIMVELLPSPPLVVDDVPGERDPQGEDPDYPRVDWQYQVANGDTPLGYWDWVDNEREWAEEDEGGDP